VEDVDRVIVNIGLFPSLQRSDIRDPLAVHGRKTKAKVENAIDAVPKTHDHRALAEEPARLIERDDVSRVDGGEPDQLDDGVRRKIDDPANIRHGAIVIDDAGD